MKRLERFNNLDEVRAEKERLAAIRDAHGDRLQGQLASLSQAEVRRNILRDAAKGALSGLLPRGLSENMATMGGIASGLQMAWGARGGSLAKRAGLFLLGMAGPALLGRVERIPLTEIAKEIGISVQRVREYIRERVDKDRNAPEA
ncbi:MAG TPA: hypothetical protein PKD45_09880 [Flavobacteriales bacterium]|nr:hypothetical protein [Flavobacteriales bacterium]